jgi:hypothetical protein
VDSPCSRACEERNIILCDVAPHLDIQRSRKIHSCDPKRFLVFYPVGGERASIFYHGGFFRLARGTFVQRPSDGLASTQYPELFPECGENDPDSQVMEANVRVP